MSEQGDGMRIRSRPPLPPLATVAAVVTSFFPQLVRWPALRFAEWLHDVRADEEIKFMF